MIDLFNYPDQASYQKNSFTSKEAAKSINSKAGTMRDTILSNINSSGITIDEAAVLLDCQTGTASARMRELELKDNIVKSDNTRLTRAHKKARIYFIKKD